MDFPDEIYLTIAPKLSGDEGAASLADGPRHLQQGEESESASSARP